MSARETNDGRDLAEADALVDAAIATAILQDRHVEGG